MINSYAESVKSQFQICDGYREIDVSQPLPEAAFCRTSHKRVLVLGWMDKPAGDFVGRLRILEHGLVMGVSPAWYVEKLTPDGENNG